MFSWNHVFLLNPPARMTRNMSDFGYDSDLVAVAKQTISKEIAALSAVRERLGPEIRCATELILAAGGMVVTTGIGKSGYVAQKIAGTLSGTGSPATYLHPVDALHGECGIVRRGDVVLALSKSGETEEVVTLLTVLKTTGCKTIALVGNPNSRIAAMCDVVLDGSVAEEACPLNLAPTSSAMVAMALGDALAVCLMSRIGFSAVHFSKLHPSGSLGKKLLLRVDGVMHVGEAIPLVSPDETVRQILVTLSSKTMGAVIVVDTAKKLLGIFTDGDLRRTLEQRTDFLDLPIEECMTKNPIRVQSDDMAIRALDVMENRKSQIAVLPVVDTENTVVGIIRLHDLMRVGLK